jgi:hypothetical protein
MHDGSFEQADNCLRHNITPYVDWAMNNNSLLILTWDEDDYRGDNHIVTLMVGPMVKQGKSAQRINHYNLLRTLTDFYDLPPLGKSNFAKPITGVWQDNFGGIWQDDFGGIGQDGFGEIRQDGFGETWPNNDPNDWFDQQMNQ